MKLPHLNQLSANNLQAPIWVYDIVGQRLVWANGSGLELWEAADLDELRAREFSGDQSDAVQQTLLSYLERFEAGESFDVWWEICPKGTKKRVFCRLSGVRVPAQSGSRVAMLLEGQYSPELLNAGDIPSAAIAVLFDEQGNIVSFNPPFADQFSNQIDNLCQILPEQDAASFVQGLGSLGRDIELKTQRGLRWHHAEVTIREQISDDPSYVLTLIDIQERKLREIEIAKEARSDFLTGLMNRRGLLQYMEGVADTPYTLFYIDLDGFKPINDTYGHNTGDELLCQLANALMAQSGRKVCARVGGDEFVVVFLEVLTPQQIEWQAERILADLSCAREVAAGCVVRVSGSIGIASMPGDAEDIHQLMISADAAMYEAKKQGRNRAVIYQQGMESYLRRRARILQHLDEAIACDKLALHYQPIVNGNNGEPLLVEALLRWHHPELGPLSPLEFITVAEESGKIVALENWVIERVCRELPEIRRLFSPLAKVTINISGAHIIQPGFTEGLIQLISRYQCSPREIVLELTESVLVPVLEQNNPCLDQLVAAGFQLAIDDFGTGYSSLAYISQLPASYVKIDKAFIDRLDQDPHTLLFIRDLCAKFGMRCIAEGVELQTQKEVLNDAGILLQQGYYFARPQALGTVAAEAEKSAEALQD